MILSDFFCMGFLLTLCQCVGCLISLHGISDFKLKYLIWEHGTQSDVPFNWNQTFHAVISDNPCNATRHHPHATTLENPLDKIRLHPHAMKSYIIGIWEIAFWKWRQASFALRSHAVTSENPHAKSYIHCN